MSKKRKALQVSALLSAVSGATLLVAAGSTSVQAAETNRVEERCYDQERTAPTTQYRLNGCVYNQYGLPGDGGDNNGETTAPDLGGGRGGPSGGGQYTS